MPESAITRTPRGTERRATAHIGTSCVFADGKHAWVWGGPGHDANGVQSGKPEPL